MHLPFADFAAGTTRSAEWRGTVNEMGEVPVLEDDAGRMTTQSGVILTMLAEQHGAFGGMDDDERREILRWLFFGNHKFTSHFATWRFMKAFAAKPSDLAVSAYRRARIEAAFGIVDKHLAGRTLVVGDALTIADMSLSGYLFYRAEESGYELEARFREPRSLARSAARRAGLGRPVRRAAGRAHQSRNGERVKTAHLDALDWPFGEPRHRAFATELDAWAAAHLAHAHADDRAAVDDLPLARSRARRMRLARPRRRRPCARRRC